MEQMDNNIYPVLLAGGSGTRLWPVSRERHPKQLVSFEGRDSLLQNTIKRLQPLLDVQKVKIVCGKAHGQEIANHLSGIDILADNKIICEPVGMNTAPAVLLAVTWILKTESIQDAIFIVLPADHVIKHLDRFHAKIRQAIRLAAADYIVTFGIQPDYPETGYGYIEGQETLSDGALTIRRFVEKPDIVTAEKYVRAGNFFWNSGMFAFKVSVILDEFKHFAPDMLKQMNAIVAQGDPISRKAYERLPSISFDYAIMEKTGRGVVLPADFGWSDIGTWKSLYTFLPKDENANVLMGDTIAQASSESLVFGQDRLIAINGLKRTVVIDTADAVFVSDLDNSRDVKTIATHLKRNGRREYRNHPTETHTWGYVQVLEENQDFKVSKLVIRPGSKLDQDCKHIVSWNMYVFQGEAWLRIDSDRLKLKPGDSRYVNAPGHVIIENRGQIPLTTIITQA